MVQSNNQLVLLCGGPDRCGKTNILREVEKRTGIPYFKASSEKHNFVSNQSQFINDLLYADPRLVDFLQQTKTSVLIDRAYPCEWVYSRYFKRPTNNKMLEFIDEEHSKMGSKILICTRKSFAGIQDDLDPNINEKELLELHDLYQQFLSWTKCKSYVLYVDDEDLEREANEVLNFIER